MPAFSSQTPVGVIGLGLLGEALTRRLIEAGFPVTGYDVDPPKNARFESLGGRAAASPGAVGASCDCVALAVFSTDQVETVVESELLPAMGRGSGKMVLCASTCDPDRIAVLGERLAAYGLRFLETPISGSSGQVSRGEGVGLVGGAPEALAKAEPILRTLFPTYFHVGGVGDGSRTKLAINLVLGLNRLALAEGLVFAERLGLEPAAFLDVARRAACYSQVMDIKGDRMVRGDFAPEGRITQHLKDVHLMLEQAQRRRQQLPLLQVHAEVLEACLRHGEGELDNSIVINEIRRRRGVS